MKRLDPLNASGSNMLISTLKENLKYYRQSRKLMLKKIIQIDKYMHVLKVALAEAKRIKAS
jgi:hypothetical protein